MQKTVAIVDYGMGNLRSVEQAVRHAALGNAFQTVITQDPEVVRLAERVVLPGQGAMPACMLKLKQSGMLDSVLEAAHNKPLFGVCVGMQMLLSYSEEGNAQGLDLIPGAALKFQLEQSQAPDGRRYKVPQMGWNQVHPHAIDGHLHPLWKGIAPDSWFYFVHSFYAKPQAMQHVVASTDYGGRFASAIAKDNIFATQFHPEKSAEYGLQLYRNFLHWSP